jgi:twitching motility two-component system response regulator PilH
MKQKSWEQEPGPFRGKRKGPLIVISDDDTTLLFLLASELDAEGYDVIAVEDKRELLKKLSSIKPDVIITDIVAPGMDGFEFIKEAKENPLTANIPIIAVSGSVDAHDRTKMLKLGAGDFISKPFKLNRILKSLRRVLKQEPGSSAGKAGGT